MLNFISLFINGTDVGRRNSISLPSPTLFRCRQSADTFRMTRNIIAILLFCLTLSACGQTKNSEVINGLTIDPSIKSEVEKHIENSKELDAFKDKMEVYINSGDFNLIKTTV